MASGKATMKPAAAGKRPESQDAKLMAIAETRTLSAKANIPPSLCCAA